MGNINNRLETGQLEGRPMTYIAYRGDEIEVNGVKFSLRAELAKVSRGKKSRVSDCILLTAAALALESAGVE